MTDVGRFSKVVFVLAHTTPNTDVMRKLTDQIHFEICCDEANLR